MKEDEHFFENKEFDPPISSFVFKSSPYSFTSMSIIIKFARIFLLIEQDKTDEVCQIIKSMDSQTCQKLESTYVCSPHTIEIDYVDTSVQKSLVLKCLENANLPLFKFLKEEGFDISNLGEVHKHRENLRAKTI